MIGNIDPEEEIADPLLGGLMASWMMKPKMTTSMKVGALNEVNILPRIGKFGQTISRQVSCMKGKCTSGYVY